MSAGAPAVSLFSRPGCHLCDDARRVIERVRRLVSFELEERDIEQDERLLLAYLERIPVVTIDGREAFEFYVDEVEFERLLKEAWNRRDAQVE